MEWDKTVLRCDWKEWNLKSETGIYGLYYGSHCLYIGSSERLTHRASRFFRVPYYHIDDNCFVTAFMQWARQRHLSLKVKLLYNSENIHLIEQAFIDTFKPRFNIDRADLRKKKRLKQSATLTD